jgi:hypothetical protein
MASRAPSACEALLPSGYPNLRLPRKPVAGPWGWPELF